LQEGGRVLITGANGHLGRRLIQSLTARAGAGPVGSAWGGSTQPVRPAAARPVRAVVRSRRAADALQEFRDDPNFDVVVLDYGDAAALAAAAEGCEVGVHLVGIIKESSRSRYLDAHEKACEALVAAAAAAGMRRIVHLGIVGSGTDSPNACLASRGRAEQILLGGAVPALVIRVPMVLGPGDYASRALRAQARARFVPLLRGGAGREQPIDADDVIAAIRRGIELPDLDESCLDLAGPECLSRRELLERAAALYGNRPLVIPIPLALELAIAFLLEKLLPDPPLTRAMVGVLDHDDVVDVGPACARLGIELTPLDRTLERCVGPDRSET
jgi:NADH dehydrogenase